MKEADIVIALYGSTARGDNDARSDVDVLVLAETTADVPVDAIPPSAEVSRYSWHEWSRMRDEGSIFLRHIAAESRVIWECGHGSERLRQSLSRLPEYKHVARDFDAFEVCLRDIREELASEDCCYEFELSALATLVRHLSILVCYLAGRVSFSRTKSVKIAVDVTGVGRRLASDFDYLYSFRIGPRRRAKKNVSVNERLPDRVLFHTWIREAECLLDAGRKMVPDDN